MTAAEYARHRFDRGLDGERKLPRQTISAAVQSGAIPTLPDGSIDVERADRTWAPSNTAPKPKDESAGPTKADISLQLAQLDLEAKLRARDLESGKLVDRDDVRRVLQDFAVRVRQAVESLPSSAQEELGRKLRCPKCKSAVGVRHVAIELDKHIADVLRELGKDLLADIEPTKPKRKRS
jgi:hypothetical protein